MAITLVDATVNNNQTATIPTHEAGDLIVIFAYRDGSNTAPALPAGWTDRGTSGGNSNSMRVGSRIAVDSSTTSGTWTNATTCYCAVYRSDGTIGIGASAAFAGAISTTVSFPALTLSSDPDQADHSWVVGAYGHRSTNTDGTVAPTGMTNIAVDNSGVTDSGGMHHTNGAVSSWTAQTAEVGGSSSGWRAATIEITEIPPASGGAITYTQNFPAATEGESTYTFDVDAGAAEAGRIILVGITASPGATITSATFGGETATVIASTHPGGFEGEFSNYFIGAVVPTGTGNISCTVNFGATAFNVRRMEYVIRGASWPAQTSGSVDGPAGSATLNLTAVAGDALFAMVSCGGSQTGPITLDGTPLTTTAGNDFYGGTGALHAVELGLTAGSKAITSDSNDWIVSGVMFSPAAPSGTTTESSTAVTSASTATVLRNLSRGRVAGVTSASTFVSVANVTSILEAVAAVASLSTFTAVVSRTVQVAFEITPSTFMEGLSETIRNRIVAPTSVSTVTLSRTLTRLRAVATLSNSSFTTVRVTEKRRSVAILSESSFVGTYNLEGIAERIAGIVGTSSFVSTVTTTRGRTTDILSGSVISATPNFIFIFNRDVNVAPASSLTMISQTFRSPVLVASRTAIVLSESRKIFIAVDRSRKATVPSEERKIIIGGYRK